MKAGLPDHGASRSGVAWSEKTDMANLSRIGLAPRG